jgi:hypothetical protein
MEAEKPKYQISPPALAASQALDQHFHITDVPGGKIAATLDNVAKIIDLKTQAYRVRPKIKQIVGQLNYLDVGAMERDVDRVRGALRSIEMMTDELPRFEDETTESIREELRIESQQSPAERRQNEERAARYQVSPESVAAVRELARHFDFIEKPTGQITCTENNLCIIIDMCTGMWLVHERLMRIVAATEKMSRDDVMRAMGLVRAMFRELDYAQMRMPQGKAPLNISRYRKADISEMLARDQVKNRKLVEAALSKARTPRQATEILVNASKDKLL